MPLNKWLLIILVLAAGCGGVATMKKKPRVRKVGLLVEEEEPYALRVNRTLLYPVQWGRAEDIAETLRPLLISRYGPGTQVVVHEDSNHLLIYLPPLSQPQSATTREPLPQQTTRR